VTWFSRPFGSIKANQNELIGFEEKTYNKEKEGEDRPSGTKLS